MSKLLDKKAEIEAQVMANLPSPTPVRFFYHGSSHSDNLTHIYPCLSRTFRDGTVGNFAFATHDFLSAAQHSCRVVMNRTPDYKGVPVIGGDYMGIKVFGGFTMSEDTQYPGQITRYALVNRLEEFREASPNSRVYGVFTSGFKHVDGVEHVSERPEPTLFSVEVEGLEDLMEAGIQLFEITDPSRALEVDDNWPEVDDKFRAAMLDPKNKAEGGLFRWINKAEGYDIPEGLMHDW